MIIIDNPLNIQPYEILKKNFDLEEMVFFDIETTGFSADSSYLYLIGCIYFKSSTFYLKQWFMEELTEEKQIITAFFDFLHDYQILVHYNGTGFDIPYLTKKCQRLGLGNTLSLLTSFDIYKLLLPYKKLLKLNNLKQKTVEAFLNTDRTDITSGEELIAIYQNFLGKRTFETLRKNRLQADMDIKPMESDQLLDILLLHNSDDVKGLVELCKMITYVDLFDYDIENVEVSSDNTFLSLRFDLPSNIPVPISHCSEYFQFSASGTQGLIDIPVYEGELKYFYDNYKDYFYLPKEDTAIHKSVATYVEKEFKEKAKASNCYVRKYSTFIPQFEPLYTPFFKKNVQDKLTYYEVDKAALPSVEFWVTYVKHIRKQIILCK